MWARISYKEHMEAYSKEFAEKYANGELSPETIKQFEEFMKIIDLDKDEKE